MVDRVKYILYPAVACYDLDRERWIVAGEGGWEIREWLPGRYMIADAVKRACIGLWPRFYCLYVIGGPGKPSDEWNPHASFIARYAGETTFVWGVRSKLDGEKTIRFEVTWGSPDEGAAAAVGTVDPDEWVPCEVPDSITIEDPSVLQTRVDGVPIVLGAVQAHPKDCFLTTPVTLKPGVLLEPVEVKADEVVIDGAAPPFAPIDEDKIRVWPVVAPVTADVECPLRTDFRGVKPE